MFTIDNTMKMFNYFIEEVDQEQAYLNELDTTIGDGDHGSNMKRGVQALEVALEKLEPASLADIFKTAAMTFISKVGGASGALYGSAMLEMAKESAKTADPVDLIASAYRAIEQRGKARVGDKTMLDVWHPVLEDLKKKVPLTAEQITAYADATKDLHAKMGRASYLGDRSIGHIDPGAMSSAYFFQALLKAGVLDD